VSENFWMLPIAHTSAKSFNFMVWRPFPPLSGPKHERPAG
jgi:hypothetical protein